MAKNTANPTSTLRNPLIDEFLRVTDPATSRRLLERVIHTQAWVPLGYTTFSSWWLPGVVLASLAELSELLGIPRCDRCLIANRRA